MQDPFKAYKEFHKGKHYYSLRALEGLGPIGKLPVSIRIMLESVLRNMDGEKIKKEDVEALCNWNAKKPQDRDIPLKVARVLLQDFTGIPLLVDIAAMRDAVKNQGLDPKIVEPNVPVDLVVDHSVQVDSASTDQAFMKNLQIEFERNKERYAMIKWGQQAFKTFKAVPPGIGICHQVNLEHIAQVVMEKEGVLFPDTLVGTDSHTTMINGLGVLGWGVGGIEAEAAMLGQPISVQMPEVIGVHMTGALKKGVTATDMTLRVTQMLREQNVVGKFVEFYGEGAQSLSVADRATIGNMSPEYGATMGFFPVDEKTIDYLLLTGRTKEHVDLVKTYLQEQNLFGIPKKGDIEYTQTLELDLSSIEPCVAGPKRPQDRIVLAKLKDSFKELFTAPLEKRGYAKDPQDYEKKVTIERTQGDPASDSGGTDELDDEDTENWSEVEMVSNKPITDPEGNVGYAPHGEMGHGSVTIAAITSCTNTSNPSVMLGAGLLAKKAVEKGLKLSPLVKASLAPGSRVVTDYLKKTGLQPYLDELGFNLVAYGCTTCIGNSGPLDEKVEEAIKEHDLITASVLSGNRNFEARIHSSVKANFLMSPPLVVAFAIAGRVDIDLENEPLQDGVYLKDIWPSVEEIDELIKQGLDPEMFKTRYAHVSEDSPVWNDIKGITGDLFPWDDKSTYIQKPPYFDDFTKELKPPSGFEKMRPLAILGDSVTTDHISPAGAFAKDSPAGKYLVDLGIEPKNFNSFGSRRGNHFIMMRGTFANVRIHNQLAEGKEGGFTQIFPEKKPATIFEAAETYRKRGEPLIIFAGRDYGMGSSRDWAAKGTLLLGVKAVVAKSFERIHRSNLIGMGVLPVICDEDLSLTGEEVFSIEAIQEKVAPRQKVKLIIDGKKTIECVCAINTETESAYFANGGIMPYVLREYLA